MPSPATHSSPPGPLQEAADAERQLQHARQAAAAAERRRCATLCCLPRCAAQRSPA